MKKLLTFLMMSILTIGVGWAETITFTAGTDVGSTTNTSADQISKDGVTIASTSAGLAYSEYRFYNGTITITSTVGNITSVVFTCTENSYANVLGGSTPSEGTLSISSSTVTWTGNSSSFTIRNTAQTRASKIVVTVAGSAGSVATPSFSPAAGTYYEAQNVTISCATSDATIHYTTDGSTPTTSSPTFSSAIPVSSTTTIKAIAVKEGLNNSNVATATYTINAPLTSLAEVNALENNAVFTYGAQTVVLGTYGNGNKNMYIVMPDNTAGTLVYDASNSWPSDYTFGKVINSGWSGTKTTYYTKPEVTNPTGFTLAGNTADVTPIVITSSDLTEENFGRYAVLKNVSVSANGAIDGINYYNQFDKTPDAAGVYDVYGVIGYNNNAGQFMPLRYEAVSVSGSDFYLAGTFNNWNGQDTNYKFTNFGNGTYTLTGKDLPDDIQFKIVKDGTTWYGGATNDETYGIHGGWHTNIPMTNSEGNNGVKNYKMQVGGISTITINTSNMTFTIEKETPQFYIKCSDDWTNKISMTATNDGGWTITKELAANTEFGFDDEWNWYGGNGWWVKEEHLGQELDLDSNNPFKMVDAGNYIITVNTSKTKVVITKYEAPTGDVYTLVEGEDDLVAGGEYIIAGGSANEPYTVLMGAVSNNIGSAVTSGFTYNASAKTMTLNEGCAAQILTLGGSEGAWTFYTGSAYLSLTSSSNNLYTSASADNDNAKWTINNMNMPLSKQLIANKQYTTRYLEYNSGSPRFACYTGSQQAVALFKKTSTTPPSNQVATPSINPGSTDSSTPYNVYGGKQEISITCATDGATIYYTVDGSEPTTSSTQYAIPFDLESTGGNKTVKAIAIKDGMDNSAVATSYYLFKSPNGPTFNPASGTVHNDAFNVTISSEYNDAQIYYMLDPETAPTAAQMSESGTLYENPVNVSGEGSHTIYAMVVRNGIKSSVVYATYTITSGGTTGDGEYVKVTSNANLTDGEYLIVYEDGLVGFNGALENLDATPNTISVEINNFTILSTPTVDAAVFTFDANAGTFMNANGVYIGRTSDANGLESGTTALNNTVSIDQDGNAVIVSSGGAYLRYNANSGQDKFRYFKSSTYGSQQPIALYKKSNEVPPTPTTLDGVAFTADRQWATWYGDANLALPEGVTAYVVTGVQGDAVAVEAVNYIPANTGVLLNSETGAESVSAMPYTGEAGTIPTNLLVGSLEAQTVSNAYLLYNNQFILAQDGTTVGAHRCYLPMSASAQGVPVLRIGGQGTVTGVETISTNNNGDNTYYNLMGQPVTNPTPGIYIRGGKKVIVK